MPKYVVRTGVMRALGVFTTSRDETFPRGAKVIARTDRGLEAGEILCEANDQAMGQLTNPGHGQILRVMSLADNSELHRLQDQQRREFKIADEFIARDKLEMKLVDVEHL